MLILAKIVAKILSILNGEVSPRQIAAGFSIGVLIGLLPLGGLMSLFVIFGAFLINVNLAIMFVAAGIFKIIAYAIDPIANQIGYQLLTQVPALTPFWTKLYNLPVVPYTKFNNTLVLGSLVLGIVLLIPAYFLAKKGIVQYRTHLKQKVLDLKIMKMFQASSIYQYYQSFKGIVGK
ncbi:MAG: TIGR03546 family protein [Elusimicrobiota bacterium]